MHPEVVAALRCPHEGEGFTLEGRTLVCARGHRFDLARQGYVHLAVGRHAATGDDAAMVAAREQVLATGRLDPLTRALADALTAAAPGTGAFVDLGAGTGHHLAAVLDLHPGRVGLALDLSKHACRRAARRHPRLGAAVADVWQPLPVRTGAAAAVLCVFAPRNAPEIVRVLADDGVLVVATPAPHHLGELVGPLGLVEVDPRKRERLHATLDPVAVEAAPAVTMELDWQLARAEVRAIVAMGPSADHLTAEELDARVATLPETVAVTAAVEVRTFRPR